MPWYEHECTACGYEFEDLYGINTPPPTTCPECGKETVKRVMSLTAKGVVELSGQDLKQSIKESAKKIAKEATKNENLKASLIGEEKFNSIVK